MAQRGKARVGSRRGKRRPTSGLSIVAGSLGGRLIEGAASSRPTQARVREALFSRWQQRVVEAKFLDLFCGGGAVALEALSRGATAAFLVDVEADHLMIAKNNASRLGVSIETVRMDLRERWTLPASWPKSFDLIFADPPYDFDDYDQIVEQSAGCLADGGEAVIEHSVRSEVRESGDLLLVDQRTYGETALSFFRRGLA